MNSINRNIYNKNIYPKDNINRNSNIKQINTKELLTKQSIEPNNLSNEEVINIFNKIKEQVKSAQLISIKIVKGENITKNELKFLSENYPDMKNVATETIKEAEKLKNQLKNCKGEVQKQEIIHKAISNIKIMLKKGLISDVQASIKMSGIEEAQKILKDLEQQIKKAESIAVKTVKGEYITENEKKFIKEKFPRIYQMAKESLKELNDLKSIITTSKTHQQIKNVIDETSKDLDKILKSLKNNVKEETQLKTNIKLKMVVIDEAKEFSKQIEKEIKKSENIVLKMIKGKYVSLDEEKFIIKRYPNIKEHIKESIEGYEIFTQKMKDCKTQDDKKQLISKFIVDTEDINNKVHISSTQILINTVFIEEIKSQDKIKDDRDKDLYLYLNPYIYLNPGIFLDKLPGIAIVILIIIIWYIL